MLFAVFRGEEGWIKDKMNYEAKLRQGSMCDGAAIVERLAPQTSQARGWRAASELRDTARHTDTK
jgi:hypothetical protein